MSVTVRNPTETAACGCPYDPEYDAGYLGWHLQENHPEVEAGLGRDVARLERDVVRLVEDYGLAAVEQELRRVQEQARLWQRALAAR